MDGALITAEIRPVTGTRFVVKDIENVFFINAGTHGDTNKLSQGVSYDDDQGVLWVNSDRVISVQTKGQTDAS